jgi:hypothetical protein
MAIGLLPKLLLNQLLTRIPPVHGVIFDNPQAQGAPAVLIRFTSGCRGAPGSPFADFWNCHYGGNNNLMSIQCKVADHMNQR